MSNEPAIITIEEEEESPTNAFISRNGCCFHLPCFTSAPRLTVGPTSSSASSTTSFWDRLSTAESNGRWWARPFWAIKKLREWSEIVAGPKWKTFIRRFNRHRNRHQQGKFQYDPLSYALNFDDGPGQNGHFDEDFGQFPDFSSRFAAVPLSARSSMDLGKGALAG